jgi:hypothetical protein
LDSFLKISRQENPKAIMASSFGTYCRVHIGFLLATGSDSFHQVWRAAKFTQLQPEVPPQFSHL